jgi:ketosteroid isomerase-like protein
MKRIVLSATILLASFGAPALAADRAAADVALADQRLNLALERADIATLRDMIADEYVFTDPTGRVAGRDEVIGGVAWGRIHITSQTTRDVQIRVYGHAAVETGLLTSVAVRDGRNSSGTFRFTRLWVKQAGRWKTAAIQETAPEDLKSQ